MGQNYRSIIGHYRSIIDYYRFVIIKSGYKILLKCELKTN